MEPEHSTNDDRLEYLYLNLVGQVVQVHTVDGTKVEGLFVSRSDPETPEEEAGVFLACTRYICSDIHVPLDPTEFYSGTTLFFYKDIVVMEAKRLKMRTETPGSGQVHNYRGEHDLKMLDWAQEGNGELLEEDRGNENWDQFKANERFGVRSTYDESIYTTTLDKSKMSKEDIARADRIAREIECSGPRNAQHLAERQEIIGSDIDDATLFSDVARKPKREAAPPAPQPSRKGAADNRATAAASAAAATGAAKRGGDAPAPPPLEAGHGRDFNPNPAARPFVPSRPIITDYLKSLAEAIAQNPNCLRSDADWPGDEDHYDKDTSNYTLYQQQHPQQQQQQQQQLPPQQQQQQQQHYIDPMMAQQQQQQQHMQQPPPPQQQQPTGYGNVPPGPPAAYNRGGHQVMQPGMPPHGGYPPQMMGGYHNNAPPPMGHSQPYMEPGHMAGPSNGQQRMPPQQQQQQQQQPPPPPPPQQQQRGPPPKSSQPQQPVVTALPPQQQQQQQQQQAPVDSGAGVEKPAAQQKKLQRGGARAGPARAGAASDEPATAGKRSGK